MAKDFRDTITIKFKPEDDQKLIRAINSLDKATKSLLNTQAKLVDKERKASKTSKSNRAELKKLFIQLKANGKGFKDAGVNTHIFTKALKGNKIALQQVKNQLNAHNKSLKDTKTNSGVAEKGIFDLGHSARQTGGAFSVLRSKLLLFNFAMALGIRQIIKFTNVASKVQSMETAFKTLSGGASSASVSIDKLRDATNNTMSSFDLFQQANNAMILGVTKNSDEMAKMFDMAQRLGRALGKDTKMSVESLITGIGRQSRLMLDNIGIIIKAEDAYGAYAEQVGKSADDLSDAEKKQAFFNATMKSATQAIDELGIEILNANDYFQQLDTSIEELSNRVGNVLIPMFTGGTQATTEFIDSLDEKTIIKVISTIEALATTFVLYKGVASLARVATILLAGGFTTLGAVLTSTGIGALLTVFVGSLSKLYSQIQTRNYLMSEFEQKLLDLKVAQQDITLATKLQKTAMENWGTVVEEITKKHTDSANEIIQNESNKTKAIIDALGIFLLTSDQRKQVEDRQKAEASSRAKWTKMYDEKTVKKHADLINQLVDLDMEYYDEEVSKKRKESMGKNVDDIRELILDKHKFLLRLLNLEGDENTKNRVKELEELLQFIQTKKQLEEEGRDTTLNNAKQLTSALKGNVQARMRNEIDTLKQTSAYKNADSERRQDMEDEIARKYAKRQKALFMAEKGAKLADVYFNTASAVAKSVAFSPLTAGQPWAGIAQAMGVIQAGAILSTPAPQAFAKGGDFVTNKPELIMVGEAGREHVKITPIDRPESRALKDGSSINITIQGGIIQEDYVRNELIPALNKATSLGARINA
jgi:hypothetical protein